MASITNLADYAKKINTKPKPTDLFSLKINRSVRDLLTKELIERQKRLNKAVSDPMTKKAKRAKREKALAEVTDMLNALNKAEQI